jgi:NADH dehydrogenase
MPQVNGRQEITVLGGTGFLGGRVVRHLAARRVAVRVAARHAERRNPSVGGEPRSLRFVRTDINDDASVQAAVTGAIGVVNAVSLYAERGRASFHAIHVEAAARLAKHARDAGVERLVHVSGIGADPQSSSSYIRSRGEGEEAVRAAFPAATIVRPAVMFGPGDSFVTPLTDLVRRLPMFPLFGQGLTRLQPVSVEDVAEAIARALTAPKPDRVYELAGPRVYTYRDLIRVIADRVGARPVLVSVPRGAWQTLGFLVEMMPRPLITRSQVELMAIDNVASPECPGFGNLGMAPRPIDSMWSERRVESDD